MPYDHDRIDEIVDLILETVCTRRRTVRIAGDDYPAELVKAKFMKLDSEHIRFVLDCMRENTTKIHNIKQYLRAALFNAPSTIGNYYTSLVAHDMAGIAQKYNCALTRLDYQQEAGLMSSVPLGENLIPIQRGLTTSSTAIFIPFITQELFQTGGALYYGLNALSNNMILCDRKQLKNPKGLILGTPGSEKSFAAKREMTNAFLITDDDIIICDPEAEYFSLVQRLNRQVVRLSPAGKGMDGKPQYVNPMDINLNYSEDDNPLALKSDFILSLCELVIGGKEGLQPVDKTVIDRTVRNVYRPFLADPDPAKMPILGDLYNELLKQPESEAARIAAALELYISGSLNVFNHRTNVELNNRLVCFDIKQLGKQLKKLGMLIVQDQVWNRVTVNRAEKKATHYYMDEFHLLLKE